MFFNTSGISRLTYTIRRRGGLDLGVTGLKRMTLTTRASYILKKVLLTTKEFNMFGWKGILSSLLIRLPTNVYGDGELGLSLRVSNCLLDHSQLFDGACF